MSRRLMLPLALAVVMQAGAAHADAIDGDWCSADGQRMSIRGDNITIPSGRQIAGNYSRHAFDYVIPPGDSGAGDTVNIILRSEYLAFSRQGANGDKPTEWRRCKDLNS
ncbi:hypothetical protein [Bradyrhizobium sp.]|uniref:hypothetical protein n=1 Tax=Bradyrhizobium sp. TaxID=376 RepID=UPI001DD7A999|nr:hypothetical protein [Bradyrhizobium sp.]MBI5320771.1 hypothetical protein [Bradyrhizobium sp.]